MEDENIFQGTGRLSYQLTDQSVLTLHVHRMNVWSIFVRRSMPSLYNRLHSTVRFHCSIVLAFRQLLVQFK